MNTIELLRQFRIGEYAIFDFVVSFAGIFLITPWMTKLFRKVGIEIPTRSWMLLTLPMSILIHLLVGNITPMTKNFFDANDHYLFKALILGLTIAGVKGIKRRQ